MHMERHERGIHALWPGQGEFECHKDVVDVAALQQELALEPAFDVIAVREVEGLGPDVGTQDPEGNAAGSPSD